MPHFSTRRRVEFADTDLGGIAHFSRFLVYMETAEHELLRSLGMEVHTSWDGYTVGWPRISVRCDFRSPARFGDLVDIHLWVERRGATSLSYLHRLETGGRLLAEGAMTAVCCRLDDPAGLRPIPIPEPLASGIDRLLADAQR